MGEWRVPTVDWRRSAAVACDVCGRPLFGRVWSAEVEGRRLDFCDPGCESLYVEYWLPRHGPAAAGQG